MAIGDDFSIAANGDIRYTGSGTTYTVIAFHRWLGDLMDDPQASGNDFLDITDATASERSTDNIITLNSPYNIDEYAAQFLYDGSITQKNGDEIYDGALVLGPAGMYLDIVQDGAVLTPNFWTTGLNADATAGISHRFMVKVRTAAADIDGRRIRGQTREFGSTYAEFAVNGTVRGNNVIALTQANDLNNAKTAATVAGYTNITNVEGYRLIDVNGDGTTENYYSEWNKDTQSINDVFERGKWITQRAASEDAGTDTGTNYPVGDGTNNARGQSFTMGAVDGGANNKHITSVIFSLKKVGSPTGTIVAELYAHTGSFGSTGTPTGAALATSRTYDVSQLTTSYADIHFGFVTTVELTASTNYFVAVRYTGGDGSNYVDVEGAAAGAHAGNLATDTGSWAATAAADLQFDIFASADLYGLPGVLFRGITHQIPIDTHNGVDFTEPERVTWNEAGTASSGQLLAIGPSVGGSPSPTYMWIQLLTGVAPTDGTLIMGSTGSPNATVLVNGTVTARTISQPFIGASTGSALIGAYGVGVESADLTSSDLLTDLFNNTRQPPNNVTFTVSGLETDATNSPSEPDYVIVGPLGYRFEFDNGAGSPSFVLDELLTFTTPAGTATLSWLQENGDGTGVMIISEPASGSVPQNNSTISGGTSGNTADVRGAVVADVDVRQLELSVSLSGAAVTSIVCTAAIPTDTPTAGTIRVQLDNGIFRRVVYTSYSGSTFTTASIDWSTLTALAGNSIYVSYIDRNCISASESFTSVYSADRNLFIRVRDGGASPIKTFETTGTLGTGGGSATAIRTSDA